jgi:hypothetical protein
MLRVERTLNRRQETESPEQFPMRETADFQGFVDFKA